MILRPGTMMVAPVVGASGPVTVDVLWDSVQGSASVTGVAISKLTPSGWDNLIGLNQSFTDQAVELTMDLNTGLNGYFGFGESLTFAPNPYEQAFMIGVDFSGNVYRNESGSEAAISTFIGTDLLSMEIAANGTVTAKKNGSVIYTYVGSASGMTLFPLATLFTFPSTFNTAATITY